MKPKIVAVKIHIPEPCSQPWEEMTPEGGGRHCAACAQTIVNFTRMSDAQILEVMRSSVNNCGRYRADQLNRELVALPAKNRFSFNPFYKLIAGLVLVFYAGRVTAQKPGTAVHAPEKNPLEDSTSKVFIAGIVNDQEGKPVDAASIRLFSSEGIFLNGIPTNSEGKFRLEVPKKAFSKESLYFTTQSEGYQINTTIIKAFSDFQIIQLVEGSYSTESADAPSTKGVLTSKDIEVMGRRIGTPEDIVSVAIGVMPSTMSDFNPTGCRVGDTGYVVDSVKQTGSSYNLKPEKWWAILETKNKMQ